MDISCFGLRRSGNHAIINWIIRQSQGNFVHLNDVKLYHNKDPYQSFSKATVSGINPLIYQKSIKKWMRTLKYLHNPQFEYLYDGNSVDVDDRQRKSQKV